jgi:hypothetical protein
MGMWDGTVNAFSGRDVRGPCRAPLARSLGWGTSEFTPSAVTANAGAFVLSPV